MVNGKPTLTFGDNPYTAPSSIRHRTGNTKARGNNAVGGFESYLPVADYASQAKAQQRNSGPVPMQAASPAGAQANAGLRQPPPLAVLNNGLIAPAQKPAARFGQALPAGYPDANYSGAAALSGQTSVVQNSPQRPTQPLQNTLPTGGHSRVDARAYAQSNMESFGANRELGSPTMRLSQKNMPRISGRPISGRHDFGMVDTRKTLAGQGAMPSRGELGYASPNAMQARAPGVGQNADSGFNGYARSAGKVPSGQSFVTHGFGGGNAELALRSLGYDIREQQPATTYARRLDADSGVAVGQGGLVFGSGRPVRFADDEDAARTAVLTASHRKKPESQIAAAYPGRSLVNSFYTMAENGLGALAAKFESGSDGISAIGFDRKGGTSYGKYQIASRVGTMSAFIEYLDEKAPDIAKRLRSAGPANTGGRSGRMPTEWKNIAAADPARFEKLQEDFIRTSHFEPAMRSIAESTGVGFDSMPVALQEVLFSTAVQHGPFGAVRIFNQALNNVGVNKLQATGKTVTESFKRAGRQLIKQVYALRAGQFMSSTSGVQSAVRNRLNQEMNEALEMLA